MDSPTRPSTAPPADEAVQVHRTMADALERALHAGDGALKLKKPLSLGFLDFSTSRPRRCGSTSAARNCASTGAPRLHSTVPCFP